VKISLVDVEITGLMEIVKKKKRETAALLKPTFGFAGWANSYIIFVIGGIHFPIPDPGWIYIKL